MFTYSDYLNLCWSISCWDCSCLIDDDECPIYCNNCGYKFCNIALFDILLDYYHQSTGAVFIPSGSFLDDLEE